MKKEKTKKVKDFASFLGVRSNKKGTRILENNAVDEEDFLNAIELGNFEDCKRLLDQGVSANAVDSNGSSALCIACRGSNEEIVKLLLDHGADVDGGENSKTRNPLINSIFNGFSAAIKMLLDAEANPNIQDAIGQTAVHHATWEAASGAGPEMDISILKMIVEKGGDLEVQNDDGWTALHVAAYHGAKNVVEYIVSKGASMEKTDKFGYTPLALARRYGKNRVMISLLNLGAEPLSAFRSLKDFDSWHYNVVSWGRTDANIDQRVYDRLKKRERGKNMFGV